MLRNLLLCTILLFSCMACQKQKGTLGVNKLPPRRIELPDGWSLSPVGQQLVLGDLPLQVIISADGRRAMVSNNGQSGHSLQWLDLEKDTVLHTLKVPKAWYGLAGQWLDFSECDILWGPEGDLESVGEDLFAGIFVAHLARSWSSGGDNSSREAQNRYEGRFVFGKEHLATMVTVDRSAGR